MSKNKEFRNYEIRERESKSFHFTPEGNWCQSFVFTWLPGFFIVTGDMGEMVIQHYNAMITFDSAINWLAKNALNKGYIEQKIQAGDCAQKKYFPKETFENIKECLLNEDYEEIAVRIVEYLHPGWSRVRADEFCGDRKKLVEEFEKHFKGEVEEETIRDYFYDPDDDYAVYDYKWDGRLGIQLHAVSEFANKMVLKGGAG